MSGLETKNREDSWKYKRIVTALAACGFTEKYEAKFLENEMDNDLVQSCVDNPQEFDYYLSSIIPKVGHKLRFITEFKKTKGNEGETASSSEPPKNTPEQIQQPDSFVNKSLDRVTMEIDDVLVEEEPEDGENNNNDDGEPEVGNFRNQMPKLKRSQDPPEKVNMEVDDVQAPAKVEAEQNETENNNERNPEVGNSKKSNPMAKPKEFQRKAEKEEKKGKESEKQKDGPLLNKKSDKSTKLKKREKEQTAFICDYCQKEFSKSSHLKLHIPVHTGQKDYHCNLCDFSASQKGNLEVHIRRHLNERNFKCPEVDCGVAFVSSSELKKHQIVHNKRNKKFICSACPYKTHKKDHLTRHMKTIHSELKRFKCPHENCQYSAKQKIQLKQHVQIHSEEKDQVCPHPDCGFKTKWSDALKRHMKNHSNGEKRYKCNFCDFSSHRHDNLVVHIRVHTGETPFACQLCSYKSKSKGDLTQHMKKHAD